MNGSTKATPTISKNLGRYNMCSNDKSWCVQVLLPDGKWVSEHWPQDQEPDIDGMPPSEVLGLIAERSKTYWISTGREELLARIEKALENGEELDSEWAKRQIAILQRQINRYQGYVLEIAALSTEPTS